jgi:hypothetical protein
VLPTVQQDLCFTRKTAFVSPLKENKSSTFACVSLPFVFSKNLPLRVLLAKQHGQGRLSTFFYKVEIL